MLGVNLRGEMKVFEDKDETSSHLLDLPLIVKMKESMRLSSQEVRMT